MLKIDKINFLRETYISSKEIITTKSDGVFFLVGKEGDGKYVNR